ncbi:MAG TPA: hypothetical protein VFQ61_02770 [Polyangiaceae bacterium]|nr:hypothetical protein [Polyangiaceae bacterium]
MSIRLTKYVPFLCLAFASFTGCGGDEAPPPEVIPSLAFSSVLTSVDTYDAMTEGPVAAEIGCDAVLAFAFTANDYSLTQPGNCESNPRCGHVRVSVSKEGLEPLTVVGTGIAPLAVPLTDDQSVEAFTGSLHVEAVLLADDGSEFKTQAGDSIQTELDLEIPVPSCPEP